MSSNGIDLSQSGWDNPDGFVKAPRPSTPAPPVRPVCEAVGPHGWVCDLPAGHPHEHKADDGSPDGLRWTREMVDVSTLSTPPDQPVLIPGRLVTVGDVMDRIAELADEALKSESPAAWVLALDKIRTVARS